MIRNFIYYIKRAVEYYFIVYSNRNLKGFKEKSKAARTLIFLYFKSIGNNKEEQTTVKFFDFKITGLNAASLLYLFQEIFLNEEYFFQSTSQQPKIIDCGANIGSSVLFFKKLYPLAEIIAIEPNPIIFKLLEKNINDNNLKGVKLLNCCLSNKDGYENFYFEKEGGSNLTGSIYEIRGNKFQFQIESKKLSSIIQDELFHLIKIDVEGAERQIFQDLVENDKIKSSDNYFIEYHHHAKMENIFSEIISFFDEKGYNFNLRSKFNKSNSFQDILIFFHKNYS